MDYCRFCAALPDDGSRADKAYHDHVYGFPVDNDTELFARLVLEINQAGLSWRTILDKEAAFRRAYSGFDIDAVAAYGEADRARLLADAGIVRNRRKIDAAICNARSLTAIRSEYGGFALWLDSHHPRGLDDWVRLFKTRFVFVGREIVGEFLKSTGYLSGAHRSDCPVYPRIVAARPPWLADAAANG